MDQRFWRQILRSNLPKVLQEAQGAGDQFVGEGDGYSLPALDEPQDAGVALVAGVPQHESENAELDALRLPRPLGGVGCSAALEIHGLHRGANAFEHIDAADQPKAGRAHHHGPGPRGSELAFVG